jgi:lysophospholipase L1-like esterase
LEDLLCFAYLRVRLPSDKITTRPQDLQAMYTPSISYRTLLGIAACGLSILFLQSSRLSAQVTASSNPATTAAAVPPEIAAFEKADAKQMPPSGAVLFIGSSSIRLWTTLAQDFPEIPVINRGFGGSLIQDSTQFADQIVIPYNPKMIVLYAGTNDLDYGNKTPEEVFSDYKAFVSKVHAALPNTRIIFISINPTAARWKEESKILEANYLIKNYALTTNSKDEKLSFIDSHSLVLGLDGRPQVKLLRSDGQHFNADGYKLWKSIVKPQILAFAKEDGVQMNTNGTDQN